MICCLNPDCPNPLNPKGKKSCQTCSTSLVPLLRNRFRVIRVLSDEGGFGRTYLSEDTDKLNELCVIKQLAPKFQGTWSQKKAMELFAEEAKRLQELGEHPQIPTLIAYFEQDNCLYLVQQFINGQNLLKELQQRKVYKANEIQAILLDLVPVLKFIHDRGVIHRDIKPENLIRCRYDGRLSLIDFGSSKQLTEKVKNKSGTSIGSHGYSPLEQIRDGKAYPASDLFSLGATCFHLLTGTSPFQLWMEHGYGWVNNWRQYLRSPLTPELDGVMNKLLQKDLKQRYQSADEVIKDLIPKPQLALPAAGQSSGKFPVTRSSTFSFRYALLKSLVLASAFILLFGFSEVWYQQYRQIQATLLSRLKPLNYSSSQGEVAFNHSPNTGVRNISLANTFKSSAKSVMSVAISPDGRKIASIAEGDRIIKVWNLATGKEILTIRGHSQKINAVAISPNSKTLVSGSDDQTIKVWNLATGKIVRTLQGHSDSIQALGISPNGKILVSGSDDNTLKVWNLSTGRLIRTLKGHKYWVRSVAISPDGRNLASGSFDKTIKLWHLNQENPARTLKGNNNTVTSVAFSPDNTTLASTSRDRTIKLWDVASGEVIRTLAGHTNTVTYVAFSPDGITLASTSRDRTIKLWNLATGEAIHTLTGHQNNVTSVAFTTDGKTIISGSEDNTIKIWRISN
ncbi:serine/threonine protein kinase [Fortiea sp. LEGE XX443]|uniref:serine/threonine-protein kinase n=1 Tax=Fortiea sp. LEGE XX443 TaxID=1828611 RepID=UPI00188051A4|nr:serine/threonine-protein kinase [Fortiea sp. LEGE XX443]MBE9004922.1 serine/threonine protein kinase [Fortiea sp. LEGE XX443]